MKFQYGCRPGFIKKTLGCLFSLVFGIVLLFIVFGFVGVYVADHYAVNIASKVLQQRTGFSMSVATQDISALNGSADLHTLQIDNPDRFAAKDFATLKEFKLKVEPATLISKRVVIDELVLDLDTVAVVKNKDGEYNLIALKNSLQALNLTIPPFTIKKLTLRIGAAKLLDFTLGNPKTIAQPMNYERTFTDVTDADITSVATSVATDMSAKGAVFLGDIMLNNVLQGVSNAIQGVGNAVQGVGSAVKNLFKSP